MSKEALSILNKYWGYSSFKGSQLEIIDAVLEKQDVLALLPTGGGKSLCYQIPALLNPGICIVVSPLIALIQDQVSQLKKRGIKAIALTGGISQDQLITLLDNCLFGNYKFLYLSPERLQQSLVQERIAQMQVNLFAIDEAHCISQWGSDFRPAYLQCALLRDIQPGVPYLALTATATTTVVKDIALHLKLEGYNIVRDSFERSNIAFRVIHDENKQQRLLELCSSLTTSGIVYVRSRRLSQQISGLLNSRNISADFYHGGLPKSDKTTKLNAWLEDKTRIMVATNAFGMGIDKPDVGLVVHYQIPDSMENYYQEAGRAGRDGRASQAILITNTADAAQLKSQFLDVLPDVAFLKMLYKKLGTYFQVPYGTLPEEVFQFSIEAFSETYKLPTSKTYNALQILDQNSILGLSQNFSRNTRIQFITNKEVLQNYLVTNKEAYPLIQIILRTYGGVFDFETRINLFLLGKKSGLSEEQILKLLEKLSKDNIILFKNSHRDMDLVYLAPREDDRTINVVAPKVKQQIAKKEEQIDQMLAYVNNATICRKIQILRYFGEKTSDICGKCDVCLAPKPLDQQGYDQVKQKIIGALLDKARTSRELIPQLPFPEKTVLEVLQHMLEEELVQINTKNEYELTK